MLTLLPEPLILAGFLTACLMLSLTPGADMMFTIASGVSGGARGGIGAALGVNLGVAVHVAMAAGGLAALIATSPLAYDVIRYLGAGYLLWIAWRGWNAPPVERPEGAPVRLAAVILRGFTVNILNPKTALFIFAFLPQFADPARGPLWAQIALLGACFIALGFTVNSTIGALAGLAAARLTAASRFMNRLSALIFTGLAARLVLD